MKAMEVGREERNLTLVILHEETKDLILLHFCSFKGGKEQTVENRVICIAFYERYRR